MNEEGKFGHQTEDEKLFGIKLPVSVIAEIKLQALRRGMSASAFVAGAVAEQFKREGSLEFVAKLAKTGRKQRGRPPNVGDPN